ncbi:MAG: flavin reductase family protein [Clostridia bacterium]|nr:flavin reductase family protein [Clostridia bacterium]MBR4576502.1 flavin reductase family protein [Clostridia bacterium]
MSEYVSLKPSTLLNPTPVVLVSCAEKGNPENRDLVTVAWAGTVNSEPPMVSVSIRKSRYSHGLISGSGEFVVNLVDERMAKATDFCGVRSGRDTDKEKETGLKTVPAEGMETAPRVDGAPVSLSCRVRQVIELGSHDMFIGEVKAVCVRKDLLDEKNALHLEKAGLIAYSHGLYHRLGGVMGFFGWSVARPDVLKKRMEELK